MVIAAVIRHLEKSQIQPISRCKKRCGNLPCPGTREPKGHYFEVPNSNCGNNSACPSNGNGKHQLPKLAVYTD
jgi:hypothetical protein